MRRQIVFVVLLAVLIVVTILITRIGKLGIYTTFTYSDILTYTKDHLQMVSIAVLIAIAVGVPFGILVTRPGFTKLTPLVVGGANVGQSIPSLAVIAIMAPLLGFGLKKVLFWDLPLSAIVALFIYGLLPILRNSYAAMRSIDPAIIEAARGMGMTRWQIIRRIELPLARPVIMAGIRIATVITVGTAELAVLVGGKGLGTITLTGVLAQQPLLILQGAAPTAILAISLGFILERIESWMTPRGLKIKA